MEPEKNIENLLSRAKIPELPPGLKERVLSAAQAEKKRNSIIFKITSWAAAACILITVTLQVFTGIKEDKILHELNGSRPVTENSEQKKLFKEFGLVWVKAEDQADNSPGLIKWAESLKGVYNGE